MKQFFCIYRLLKRAVQYPGIEVLVPESWQLMPEHVSENPNSAELSELVNKNNRESSFILVKVEAAEETALPKLLKLEEGLKLALVTQDYLSSQ